MKLVWLALLVACSAFAQLPPCDATECLQGYATVTTQNVGLSCCTPPYYWFQARNANVNNVYYTVRTCVFTVQPTTNALAFCAHGTTDSVEILAHSDGNGGSGLNARNGYLTTAPGYPTIGTKNIKDGNVYWLASWVISQNRAGGDILANDLLVDFTRVGSYDTVNKPGYPWQYDTTHSNIFENFQPAAGPALFMTPSTAGVLVNTAAPCSIGSASPNLCGTIAAGNKICTVGGNDIYDNGAAGIHIQKWSIPCDANHIFFVSRSPVDGITLASFTANEGALSIPSTILSLDISFASPTFVGNGTSNWLSCKGGGGSASCYSYSGLWAMWNVISGNFSNAPGSACIDSTAGYGDIGWSPAFNNPVANPHSSYGFLYTYVGTAFRCNTSACNNTNINNGGIAEDMGVWKALENQVPSAPSNPLGLKFTVAWTTDVPRGGIGASTYRPASNGQGILANITNILNDARGLGGNSINPPAGGSSGTYWGYYNATQGGGWPNTFNFTQGAGFYLNATSFGGAFLAGGTTQAFNGVALDSTSAGVVGPTTPAALAFGFANEPCETFSELMPFWNLVEAYYGQGYTLGQAAWLGTKTPWKSQFFGDGLVRLFSPPTVSGWQNIYLNKVRIQ